MGDIAGLIVGDNLNFATLSMSKVWNVKEKKESRKNVIEVRIPASDQAG